MTDIRINLEDIPSLEGKRVIVSGQYVFMTKIIRESLAKTPLFSPFSFFLTLNGTFQDTDSYVGTKSSFM